MAAGARPINMGMLITNRKLPSIHSELVPRSRSTASTYSYAKDDGKCTQETVTKLLVLVISVNLSSLPVAHLRDDPRGRLVVTWNGARIQDETTESSTLYFNVLGEKHRHTELRFIVSSERLLEILVGQSGI